MGDRNGFAQRDGAVGSGDHPLIAEYPGNATRIPHEYVGIRAADTQNTYGET